METIYVLVNPNTGEYVSVRGFEVSGEGWTDTTTFAMPFATEAAALEFVRMSGCNARPEQVNRTDVVYADTAS